MKTAAKILITAFAIILTALSNSYATSNVTEANDGVVRLIAGSKSGTYTALTTEMMVALPKFSLDKKLRVLPIIGVGSRQNIEDLLFLKRVDLAMVQSDVLTSYARDVDPSIKNRVSYIAKMHDEEVHILAHNKVSSIYNLDRKKVGFGSDGSGTAMTAKNIFSFLNINVVPVFENLEESYKLLKKGEIDALVYVSGKPVNFFKDKISSIDPVHFLEISDHKLSGIYSNATITKSDYPNIIDSGHLKTVKVEAVLASINFKPGDKRNDYIDRFSKALAAAIPDLQNPSNSYHSKWGTIDPCEEVPGWSRHYVMEVNCTVRGPVSTDYKKAKLVEYYISKGFPRDSAISVIGKYNSERIENEFKNIK